MFQTTILRISLTAAMLMSGSATLAQDTLESTRSRVGETGEYVLQNGPTLQISRQNPNGPLLGAHVANEPRCVCTNLHSVSVICEECDQETDTSLCYTHDQFCQDTAQLGGIREHLSFFCTTSGE